MQQIAGPHQICGPNNFNCTTCHDAHGKILESSRQQLCLNCHQPGSPVMAWHTSTHAIMGVACTDCHTPHASANVPEIVGISHFDVARPKRLPMSVNDPVVCFKCHADVFAKFSMPSHHPLKEGKMFCGDCHDAHGQMEGNLRAETLNLLCWKCHAEKQGPFAYEHPPVTENCAIAILRTARSPTICCNNPPPSSACDAMSGTATAITAVAPASTSTPYLNSGQASTRTARRATPRSTVVTCRRHTSRACSDKVAAVRTFNRVIRMQI